MTRSAIGTKRSLGSGHGKPRDLQWPDPIPEDLVALTKRAEFSELLARDNIDIPSLSDREGYNPGEEYRYWITGLSDYLAIMERLPHDLPLNPTILDLGGATGRVARHFVAGNPLASVTIAEANINYVEWVNTYGGDALNAIYVGASPILDVPDDRFDFAFGISVFTHIDKDEEAWLRELARVVKPGGYVYLTILNEQSWASMDHSSLFHTLKAGNSPNEWLINFIGKPMPFERYSTKLEFGGEVNNSNTFHSSAHINSNWNKFATVVRIFHTAHGHQAAVLLKNDKHGPNTTVSSPH